MNNNSYSLKISTFHGRVTPEEANLVGYGAIISKYNLQTPIPQILSLISSKKRQYKTENWQVFTSRHQPDETLFKQLVFAIKYEGINLLILRKLFDKLGTDEVIELVQIEPLSQYSRKIWFLYEWLLNKQLNISDLKKGNFIPLIDEKIQYAVEGKRSSRHRIINNMPGTRDFCPLVFKTEKIEKYIASDIQNQKSIYLNEIHKDVMQRASSFLLLKDSKASFTIENESPGIKRALRWGKAIGEAGRYPLSIEELERLQHIIIESKRFTKFGLRKDGGFVGEHDRTTGSPLPEHISAKPQDIEILVNGLIKTSNLLEEQKFYPIISAALIAFGFVFIHPFSDGNGRLHRYLIHHILAKMNFTQQSMTFPISASILDHIQDYRRILENYSQPILELIEWEETHENNVHVLNETIDYYRYFDATAQVEFLYNCVIDTIERIIPEEVSYLNKYDEFKRFLDDQFEMPDKLVAILVRFLEQNNGILSKRARSKEFASLNDEEANVIEETFDEIFNIKSSFTAD